MVDEKLTIWPNENKKLILDYTDNHFTKEGIVGDFYREIKDFVSGLILPSQKMRTNIINDWDRVYCDNSRAG